MSYVVFLALIEYIYTGKVATLSKADDDVGSPSLTASADPAGPVYAVPVTSSDQLSLSSSSHKREPKSASTSSIQFAADLLQAAHMYNMRPLERQCCQKLIACISIENCSSIWELSVIYSLKALRVVCAHFAHSNIEPDLLASIIQEISPDLRESFQQDLLAAQ